MLLLLGNRGLETAVANGDTRTLTLHHLHTDEDITITYKRNGQYDDEALKKLDWFVRDWRKEESTHMDPQLYDLIWEVSQEFGGDKMIQVVCGYRSPATNAMLRRRSSGVARFSQHMLGKAMDFYIPSVPLEDLRIAGLRLQRGGVGYYPTSGSPFVHLDVGSVRYWPRMSREQLARVFPNGRTAYLPSDGHPLSGYALARADIEKRGASTPSPDTVRNSGADSSPPKKKKNALLALLTGDSDDDAEASAQQGTGAATARHDTFKLASVSKTEATQAVLPAAVPLPVARPQRLTSSVAAAAVATPAVAAPAVAAAAVATPAVATPVVVAMQAPSTDSDAGRSYDPPRPPAPIANAPARTVPDPQITGGTMSWPAPATENDRVPLDMALAYAAQPSRSDRETMSPARLDLMATAPARTAIAVAVKSAAPHDNITVAKKSQLRAPTAEPIYRAKPVVAVANAGMRYDDPWLRAMILAPSITDSMTTTIYGEPDLTELRSLMRKPATSLAMAFKADPYPGIAADRFSGDAVVFLTTYPFTRRTASLQ